ncbi:MAG: sigma factor [Planctomycetota bacterium]
MCRRYWLPLYGYVRRRMSDLHEAQDLTQEFFRQLLERDFFAQADPARGRFRAFLLTALKNFLANEREKAHALKRGGGQVVLATDLWRLDFSDGESRLALEQVDNETPEKQFDRQWAVALLEQVVLDLKAEFREAGKEAQFEVLKPFLAGAHGGAAVYGEAAEQLGMSEAAVKMAASRMRQRYRELLRSEIAHTVLQPEDIELEIRDLFAALG